MRLVMHDGASSSNQRQGLGKSGQLDRDACGAEADRFHPSIGYERATKPRGKSSAEPDLLNRAPVGSIGSSPSGLVGIRIVAQVKARNQVAKPPPDYASRVGLTQAFHQGDEDIAAQQGKRGLSDPVRLSAW